MSDALFSDEVKQVEALRAEIEAALHSTLQLHAKVKLVEPKTIERSMGKAQRVLDKRKP